MEVNFKRPPGSTFRETHISLNAFFEGHEQDESLQNVVSSIVGLSLRPIPDFIISEPDFDPFLDDRPLRFRVRTTGEAPDEETEAVNNWLLSIGFEPLDEVFLEYRV